MFQRIKRQIWLATVLVVALLTAPIAMSAEKLNIEDIPGEGIVVGPFGKINVVGWDWGVQSRTTSSSGGGTHRAGVSDITFTKKMDSASSLLQQSSTDGKHYPEITIKTVDTNGKSIVMRLKSVVITSVRSIGGGKENVVFRFEKLQIQPNTLK
jgi:type VI secretion system secreted protein Hcp